MAYSQPLLDRCVSAIFEFSGNEFEFGEKKIERERVPIGLEGFRQIGSFIVVSEQLVVCVQYVYIVSKNVDVGYHTKKFTLPVLPLAVPVRVTVLVW